jgi:hypothetical protein
MWTKLFVSVVAALLLIKACFPSRWRELKAQVDRGVNLMLVLLVIGYAIALTLRFWGKT